MQAKPLNSTIYAVSKTLSSSQKALKSILAHLSIHTPVMHDINRRLSVGGTSRLDLGSKNRDRQAGKCRKLIYFFSIKSIKVQAIVAFVPH